MKPHPKTKIVCTIGPASSSNRVLREMMEAGMNAARLNFSYGTHEEHRELIKRLRRASASVGRPVAILQDLPGPKLRVGRIKAGSAALNTGSLFTLTREPVEGDGGRVSVSGLPSEVRPKDVIYLADGSIKLEVVKTTEREVRCRVLVGGRLLSGKGVNVPGRLLRAPSLTKRDREHLSFGLENGVDFVAISFVRSPEDAEQAKRLIQSKRGNSLVIAKVEREEGVRRLGEILQAADGVMVARGDLGVELPVEKVPLIQKQVIRKCNMVGKPVITATQMLESMVSNPIPTRAEVTDAANAVFDGTDAVMLSEETAIGRYPVEAVRMLSKIAFEVERALPYDQILLDRRASMGRSISDSISLSASELASYIGAVAIAAPTRTGATARRISRYRTRHPILALTQGEDVLRQLLLSWGVFPFLSGRLDPEDLYRRAEDIALEEGMGKPGDKIVVVTGSPSSPVGQTDLIRVHVLRGEPVVPYDNAPFSTPNKS